MESKEPYTTTTAPLSPPPVYEKPSFGARLQEVMNTFWVYEIMASFVSLAMLAAIFGVLHHYNGWDVDLWNHSWSLGSLIGLLATISQVAMAVPLASGISQLKWTWYKDSQKLTDLDKFEQSSRGPFGSVRLLFSRPFKFLGAFGAILTILTLAFHTLVQNAISTRSGNLELTSLYGDPDYGATYPQGNNYTDSFLEYTTGNVVGDQGPSLDMVADISHGLYYTSMHFDTQFQLSIAQCPFGNCTWKNIQTLSVCSQCADISSLIGHDQGYYTLYRTKVAMDESIGLVSSVADTEYPDPNVLPGVGPLIAHITTLARPNLTSDPLGIDCALYWCVWDRSNVTMIDWNITHSVDVFWTDPSVKTTYQQTNNIELTPPTCYNELSEPIDTSQCTKTISPYSQAGLQNYFIGDQSGFRGSVNQTEGWDVSNYVMQIIYSTAGVSRNLAYDMEKIMSYMGLMMTSNIQQTIQDGISFTYGNVWIYTTLFKIRWGYMILPTILVVGSVIFMIVTIIKSLGHEKWKSSVLPLLFHPLADEVRPGAAPHKMSELKAVAENKEVRLERGHLGSQFV